MTASDRNGAEGRLIHKSSNGDIWLLVQEDPGGVLVEHRPNRPSGGRASRTSVADFLAGRDSPERAALLALIAGLAVAQEPAGGEAPKMAPASHPAGPHATEALTDPGKTPGAGALPDPAQGDADAGTG